MQRYIINAATPKHMPTGQLCRTIYRLDILHQTIINNTAHYMNFDVLLELRASLSSVGRPQISIRSGHYIISLNCLQPFFCLLLFFSISTSRGCIPRHILFYDMVLCERKQNMVCLSRKPQLLLYFVFGEVHVGTLEIHEREAYSTTSEYQR